MFKLLLIVAGGGAGSLMRYLVSGTALKYSEGVFPIGTLVVNLIGSFLIGFIWAITERTTISPNIRTFIFIGILGGFTTFSSYSLESFNLLRDGEVRLALFNIFFSNFLSIALVFAGYGIARYIISLIK